MPNEAKVWFRVVGCIEFLRPGSAWAGPHGKGGTCAGCGIFALPTYFLRVLRDLLQLDEIEGERRGFDRQAREPVVKIERFRRRRDRVNDHQPRRNFA